jgi:UDP-2,4-diacetamido-2,4,6-trideoxy-beta-L-altropyranose hydrolase
VSIGTLLIRADASAAIGTGHVMRCLALAQAWQDAGGRAVFVMAESTDSIRARLSRESCEVMDIACAADDLRRTVSLAQERSCKWVVVDGYQFDAAYQHGLKAAGVRILFLDDFGHSRHYTADLVLNQNISASPTLYSDRGADTRLLLGPRYATLRRELSPWSNWERKLSADCQRLLVMMGGSDQANITATVMGGLRQAAIDRLDVTVLVGGSNPHFTELQALAASSGLKLQLLKDIPNIGEIMAAADIAISAAGSTCWELCLLGLPSLLIDVADNQSAVAKALHHRGCAVHIGDRTVSAETVSEKLKWLAANHELRHSLARRARELVDGKGAARGVSIMRGASTLRLRPAREDDRQLLWEWANDPEVRRASFSPDPIPWETHVTWLDAKLKPQDSGLISSILIAEDDEGNPLGQIRFDPRPDGDWEVATSLSRQARGRGVASEIIKSGVREILADNSSVRIHAFVKPSNVVSLKAFERADFRSTGVDHVRGNSAIHLIYDGNLVTRGEAAYSHAP